MFASAFSSVLVISELTDPSVDDKSDADCFNMPETDSEATEEKVLFYYSFLLSSPVPVILGAMALAFSFM